VKTVRAIDIICTAVLGLGAVGHSMGSFAAYRSQPVPLLWALCASVLIALLAALNWLRAKRPHDRALAWITVLGTLCWLAADLSFGALTGNMLDPRVVMFGVVSVVLIAFGLRTALMR
jgi:hypothetical protein